MTGPDGPGAKIRRFERQRHSYSVLLPVGFAVPLSLPIARCALTAPFHPYRGQYTTQPRRSVLCGTVPEARVPLAWGAIPAGRYPAPFVHGARTFLPGTLSSIAGTAVRPTDDIAMAARSSRVKRRWYQGFRASGAGLVSINARNVSSVDGSATPSTRAGRKWRWKAAITMRVASS
jgi:hypothetical protein